MGDHGDHGDHAGGGSEMDMYMGGMAVRKKQLSLIIGILV